MDSRNPETERLYWSTEQISQYQLERLRETVERAKRSALYGSRLFDARVESLGDLVQLPLTTPEVPTSSAIAIAARGPTNASARISSS